MWTTAPRSASRSSRCRLLSMCACTRRRRLSGSAPTTPRVPVSRGALSSSVVASGPSLLTGGNERYSDESTAQSELVGIVLAGAIAEHLDSSCRLSPRARCRLVPTRRTRMTHAKAPRLEAVEHNHCDDDEQHVQEEDTCARVTHGHGPGPQSRKSEASWVTTAASSAAVRWRTSARYFSYCGWPPA